MQSRMDEIEARYQAKEEMFSVNKNRFDELATELREQKAKVQNLQTENYVLELSAGTVNDLKQ